MTTLPQLAQIAVTIGAPMAVLFWFACRVDAALEAHDLDSGKALLTDRRTL